MHKNDFNAKHTKKEEVRTLQKKIVLFLFVLVFSLTIAGAVSAADDATGGTTGIEPTVNNSTNNSQALPDPKLYDENMNLVGSYLTIQGAYSNAAVGTSTQMYTIELEENGVFTLTDFTIAKNLRFTVANGGIATIQGSNDRLIYIAPGYTVYFYNIIFENGHASDGTTLHPDGYNGGAIYNEGTLYLTNCVLRNNQAGDGGAWDYGGIGGNGGAIYNTGITTITDCEIYNNRAGDGSDGWAVLHSNGFNGGHGGAIYSTGTLTITGSEFYGNRAGNGGDGVILGDGGNGGNGGAIYNTATMTLTDSLIHNNLAGDAGAGGYQVIIGGTGGNGGNGGAIYNTGTTTITDSQINENTAGDGGSGADGSDGSVILLHPAGYTGHTGGNGGNGGAAYNIGSLSIAQTEINSNKAGNGGKGGDGGDGVDRSIVSSGGAGGAGGEGGTGGDGGAIYNTGSTLILTDSDLSGNEAGNGGIGGSGGQGGDAKASGLNAGNGRAGGVGGEGGEGGDGGAIYNQGTTQTITNSNFTGNTAGNGGLGGDGGDGGAAATGRTGGAGGQGGNFGNGGNGGAILHVSGSSTVQSNNFVGNFAGEAATPYENGGYASAGSGTQALRGTDGSDGTGGAFFASTENTGLHFNRILDNGLPDVAGGNGINIDATNNWWGTNFEGTNPFTAGRVSELVDADPWVILRLLVPSHIYNGIPVQFIGDLTQKSDGNPVGGNIPDDVQADFTATRGTLDTPQYTIDGQAPTTYSPTSSGMATFTVTVDDQTVTVNQNVEPRAVLDFTKSVSDNHPNYGDMIHFIITVQNSGPDTATDVNVTDLLPVGLVYQSHTATAGSYDHATGLWNIGSLTTSMGGVYLDILVLVNGTGLFNNTATLIQSTYPQDEVDRSATLNVDPAAMISITKTDNTTDHEANVGDEVTFTITAHNAGPDNATNVVITDVLPLGLDFVSASDGGTYDALSRTITWSAFNLNYGAPDVVRTFIAEVNAIMAGNATGIINTANATFTEYPSTASSNGTAIYVPLTDLYINSWASKNNPYVGETITLTFKLGNNGPDTARNVVFTLPIPEGMEFVDVSVDQGTATYDPVSRTITWILGDVEVGDPTAWVKVKVLSAGTFVFRPSITTDTYDPNMESNIQPVTINAQTVHGEVVNGQTVGMQSTGIPIAQLLLAVLMVLGGLFAAKRQ
ncbi:hypothetical protein BK009_11540 [Methanobacterium subterraneum]|uniref:DUF11 domain-containing protein n=1 Tax=Methanobacterium subterraneum TaxID=59277 RepID=A0A2H4VT37_9EURY|nr:hypothetical protein BK009_11540 [Methanobacterium subterraneum]